MPSVANTLVSPDRLMAFTFGFAPPLMIEAAIRHGVFNALDKGTKTIDALGVETGTSPRGLRIVLNALVGLDVLAKDEAGRYALTEESATFLVSGKPTFHAAFFLLTSEAMLSSWGKLHEIMRTGRPPHCNNREQDGVAFFQRFVEDIFPIHYPGAQALAKALDPPKTDSSCQCWTWLPARAFGASRWRSIRPKFASPHWIGLASSPLHKKSPLGRGLPIVTPSLPATCMRPISVRGTPSRFSVTSCTARARSGAGGCSGKPSMPSHRAVRSRLRKF